MKNPFLEKKRSGSGDHAASSRNLASRSTIKQSFLIALFSFILIFSVPSTLLSLQMSSNSTLIQYAHAVSTNLPIVQATANGYESGTTNVPANTIDDNLNTRWSNLGKGSWVQFDLGEERIISDVMIAWYNGNVRTNSFVISVSDDNSAFVEVYSGESSRTTSLENYDIADIAGRYVKVTVNGNSVNNWASITEVDVYGHDIIVPDPDPNPTPSNLAITQVTANGYESGTTNVPANTIDDNLNTRWSNLGKGSWVQFDLGEKTISYVDIAWYNGNARKNTFMISVSSDNSAFSEVYSGQSSGTTKSAERYDFADVDARYVKITVNGNSQNNWASISEVDVYGYGSSNPLPPPPPPADTTKPLVLITSPTSGAVLSGPSTGVQVNIIGTSSDAESGLKDVQIKTSTTSYVMATPVIAGDWSSWKGTMMLTPGSHSLTAMATDNAGNTNTHTSTISVQVDDPSPDPSIDKFGITKLFPTKNGGLEWFSTWDNGHPRTFNDAIDPDDKWFDTDHGSGKYVIDGNGKLTASGNYVRMYVHDPANKREWNENLEITTYITRISETKTLSYSGLQIFARTNHGTNGDEDDNLCDDRGYGAKVKNDGTWSFEKETAHHLSNGYVDPGGVKPWNALPKNTPVGVKYVLRNVEGDTKVKLEMYRDLTGGVNGGKWEKIYEFTDTGKNMGTKAGACASGVDPALQLIHSYILESSETGKPMLTVYLRHEFGTMEYSDFSIREIDGLA